MYLHPGLYTVTMKVGGDADSLAAVNRVPIHRALVFADADHPADTLASYLAILDRYDPAKLDPTGLLQLVQRLTRPDYRPGPRRPVKQVSSGASR